MATSGDYRIFFQIDNQSYAHILDPRTGRPVTNGVVSATVVAANCTVADGLATALMVMGPQKGNGAGGSPWRRWRASSWFDSPTAHSMDYPSNGFVIH
jgi:hypothetical protein